MDGTLNPDVGNEVNGLLWTTGKCPQGIIEEFSGVLSATEWHTIPKYMSVTSADKRADHNL